MQKYNYLLGRSIKSRVYLSILIGIGAKIFSAIVALALYYFFNLPIWHSALELFDDTASQSSVMDNPIMSLIEILILAPIIENLIFPAVFWLCSFITKRSCLPIIVITVLAFCYHSEAEGHRITGAAAFFCFAIFYSHCIKVVSPRQSYWLTVIAHFTSNLIAVWAMIFITQTLSF